MLTVQDLMTRDVVTVRSSATLREVAELIVAHAISGLPVVDDGRLLGIVTEGDLVTKARGPEIPDGRPFGRIFGESREWREQLAKAEALTAADAMTAPAITIAPERPISDAASTMTRHRVNRLPVVDGERLVGIISRSDIVRAFVRSDEELEKQVREAVLYQTLWLDPAAFEVSVRDGHVRIHGRVERRSTAQLIERVPSLIPGVIAVETDVRWEIDDEPYPGA